MRVCALLLALFLTGGMTSPAAAKKHPPKVQKVKKIKLKKYKPGKYKPPKQKKYKYKHQKVVG